MGLMEKRDNNADVKTVTQINMYIKGMFQRESMLSRITVKGEISNCTYHRSGHIYFTLKDKTSAISCVMFASNARGLKFRLAEGLSVLVRGSISVFESAGKYQLYATSIEKEGLGTLYEEYERLKKELEAKGYFDPAKKKPIPKYAMKIGVVTSPTGAVIQDIRNVSYRRNKYVDLRLFPSEVQGPGSSESLIKGIEYFNTTDVDVIIIGRGGGSLEDLFEFNNEKLVQAIYASKKPVISAVGHETDYTLADFVADLRAPTPSAAAELAVFSLVDFDNKVDRLETALMGRMSEIIAAKKEAVLNRKKVIYSLSPMKKIESQKKELKFKNEKLKNAINDRLRDAKLKADKADALTALMNGIIAQKKNEFHIKVERLKGLSPLEKISSGYAYISDASSHSIKSVEDINTGDEFHVTLKDGEILGKVINTEKREDLWQ